MHPATTVDAALKLAQTGATATEIGRELGLPRPTVRDWLAGKVPLVVGPGRSHRGICEHDFSQLSDSYVYLLGLYLGDGCISRHPRDVCRLRITLDVKYPRIIASAAAAMRNISPAKTAIAKRPDNCVEVNSYWKCWPCLLPQHGPGVKHPGLPSLPAQVFPTLTRSPQPAAS